MLKNKLNFKLINILLFILIIYFIYKAKFLWIGVISLIGRVIIPILFSFIIAYILNYFVKILVDFGLNRNLSLFIITILFIILIVLFLFFLLPNILKQSISFSTNIMMFIKHLSNKYKINLSSLEDIIENYLLVLIKYAFNNTYTFITNIVSIITSIGFILIISIYFLIYIDKIKKFISNLLINKKRLLNYFKSIDYSLNLYLNGVIRIVLITFLEYMIAYLIIGHPNFLVIALVAALANLIPYFGSIVTSIIASILSYVISYKLLIKTFILILVLALVDSYVINPIVYKKTNKINPLILIIGTLLFGKLMGIYGIVFSVPLTIILMQTIKLLNIKIKPY